VFQDREQNIWVGTENGLDRFRSYRLQPLALPRYLGEAQALAAGVDGGAWIDVAFVASPAAAPAQFAPISSYAVSTTALHAAPDGTVWSGGLGGLWKIRNGKREPVPMPPGVASPLATPVLSMASDRTGALWVSLGRKGIFALKDGRWSARGGVPALAAIAGTAIATDARGRMWFGSTNDQVALLDGATVRRFTHADGLAVGTVLAIVPSPDRVWIAGENGVAYFDGKRFVPVLGHGGEPFTGTSGLVFGADGTLWLNGGAGISAIAPGELRLAFSDPSYLVRFDRFDHRDGLLGTAAPIIPLPSAIRSKDGTLWFSTMGGVFAFDPAALSKNGLVPPVGITALKAGGRAYPAVVGLRLQPGTRALDIDFTALSYRAPERMAFRYRLDGVDQDWQDADGRRAAHYTNLAPGRYRFHVIAANDDGRWNRQGAQFAFEIAPSLTQTAWFRTLCGAAVLAALWLLYRMRLRLLARRIAAQMNARIDERERIARELHDTLLQSIMGLVLKFGAALPRLRADERKPLEDALATARQVMGEGRDRVAGLRGASLQHAGLARAIADFGDALAADSGIAFSLSCSGSAARLDDAVAEHVLAIARETVWNAFLHAQPHSVAVTLEYGARDLTLTVADDGRGMPDDVKMAGGRTGHWGIPGLRERAANIGAALALDAGAGRGTTWTLRLPYARAAARAA
jgi:signal transduction histidine kinase